MPLDPSREVRFVVVFDDPQCDIPFLYSARSLAGMLKVQAHGADVDSFKVYAVQECQLREITVRQQQGPFDENDWASVLVELVASDGTVLVSSSYSVDGRA